MNLYFDDYFIIQIMIFVCLFLLGDDDKILALSEKIQRLQNKNQKIYILYLVIL